MREKIGLDHFFQETKAIKRPLKKSKSGVIPIERLIQRKKSSKYWKAIELKIKAYKRHYGL